jgi:two-component system CheB/CheR fusion protein
MNEELQSTNEELETVNEELRQRGIDLARSNLFLSGILRSVPLGVVVMNTQLEVELWNDVTADMFGLRQADVHGRRFLSLDIGLPVDRLRQPLLELTQSPDRPTELTVEATNRRGRRMSLRLLCASVGGSPEQPRGIILLLQETPSRQPAGQTQH